jgi:hypothetical protein
MILPNKSSSLSSGLNEQQLTDTFLATYISGYFIVEFGFPHSKYIAKDSIALWQVTEFLILNSI